MKLRTSIFAFSLDRWRFQTCFLLFLLSTNLNCRAVLPPIFLSISTSAPVYDHPKRHDNAETRTHMQEMAASRCRWNQRASPTKSITLRSNPRWSFKHVEIFVRRPGNLEGGSRRRKEPNTVKPSLKTHFHLSNYKPTESTSGLSSSKRRIESRS